MFLGLFYFQLNLVKIKTWYPTFSQEKKKKKHKPPNNKPTNHSKNLKKHQTLSPQTHCIIGSERISTLKTRIQQRNIHIHEQYQWEWGACRVWRSTSCGGEARTWDQGREHLPSSLKQHRSPFRVRVFLSLGLGLGPEVLERERERESNVVCLVSDLPILLTQADVSPGWVCVFFFNFGITVLPLDFLWNAMCVPYIFLFYFFDKYKCYLLNPILK